MQLRYSNIGTTEPITIKEVKEWLKIDYDTEDALILALITQIREVSEELSGLALIDKTIEYFEEDIDRDWVKLPCPVHNDIIEVKINGEVTTSYEKIGVQQFLIRFPYLSFPRYMEVTYTTFATCPGGVKLAMLKAIAETYEKRGNTFEGSVVALTDSFYSMLQAFKVY